MGADNPPSELASGVIAALKEKRDLRVRLFADGATLGALDCSQVGDRLIPVECGEVITNRDNPVEAFGEKKDSSLARAFNSCAAGESAALVTCGATGAIFVGAMMTLKRTADTPVLAVEPKHIDGTPFVIVDCGANVDCRAEKLVGFARLGAKYMTALGVAKPRVGLLSNGAEDKKGNALVKKANELLRLSELDFVGNIEGGDVLCGAVDVVTCEGFAGNILLKTIEGTAKAVITQLRTATGGSSALDKLYAEYDYTQQGGATLLGFNVPIVKGHGAATAETVKNTVLLAYKLSAAMG